jgi:Flp pilus assembly pilin Flp
MTAITRFISADSGVAAVEYGLLLALIVLATIGAMGTLGTVVKETLYDRIAARFPQ